MTVWDEVKKRNLRVDQSLDPLLIIACKNAVYLILVEKSSLSDAIDRVVNVKRKHKYTVKLHVEREVRKLFPKNWFKKRATVRFMKTEKGKEYIDSFKIITKLNSEFRRIAQSEAQ